MKKLKEKQIVTPENRSHTFYKSAHRHSSSRYIVSLVVGYDGTLPVPNGDNGGCVDAKEAAEAAVDLVRGGGTIWTVYDRETCETTQWEDVGE